MRESTCSVVSRSELREDLVCAVAYITILPALVFLFLAPFRKRSSVRFHACQSILLNATLMVAVLGLGMAASVALLVGTAQAAVVSAVLVWTARILCMACWAIPAIRLANGKDLRLPLLASAAAREAASSFFGVSVPECNSERKPAERERATELVGLAR